MWWPQEANGSRTGAQEAQDCVMEEAAGAQGQAGRRQWLNSECTSVLTPSAPLEPLGNLGAGSWEEMPVERVRATHSAAETDRIKGLC